MFINVKHPEKGDVEIELFDSCKTITSKRFHELGKIILHQSEIGDSTEHIGKNYANLIDICRSINPNDKNSVVDSVSKIEQGLLNQNYAIAQVMLGTSITSLSLCPLIKSVNGEPYTDLSIEGAEKMRDFLLETDISYEHVGELVVELKKKLTTSFIHFYLINTTQLVTQAQSVN